MTTTATRTTPDTTGPRAVPRVRRWTLWVLVALGVGLALAPVAFQMFDRAPKGATMLTDFKPFMTQQRLAGFQTDIARIDASVRELSSGPDASTARTSQGYAQLQQQWPQIHSTMGNLLDTVQSDRGDYDAVAALPSFRLFPWFFVIPGVLVAGLALLGLFRPTSLTVVRPVLALIGVGLVLAPIVFGMWSRAPKGGHMMDDFASLETTSKVTQIQRYFAVIASGQGAIRLQVLPEVRAKHRLSDTQLAQRLPKSSALDDNWVAILNDMTPMIGAMSDNVGNYQAIRALPPFPLFPWFFTVPGVLIAGAAALSRRPVRGGTS